MTADKSTIPNSGGSGTSGGLPKVFFVSRTREKFGGSATAATAATATPNTTGDQLCSSKLQDDPGKWKLSCVFRAPGLTPAERQRLFDWKRALLSEWGMCTTPEQTAWLTAMAIKGGWKAPAATTQKECNHA